MAPPKRPLLQGEDDGEGHTWKVLRGRDGLIDIFYGRGSASKLRLRNEDKKSTPTEELVLKRISEHRAKRRQADEGGGGGGGKKAKGARLSVEAAFITSEAESSMAPSGSKGDRRAQRDFPSLQTAGRPERDYKAERRSAAENREHRRMAESFRRVQKAVDEDMDEDGSEMCHILKMLAMAIFSRHNDSTIPSSPEEKLTAVADIVSAELQEQMKHHKAAMMAGAIGKGIMAASGENVEEGQQQRQQHGSWKQRRIRRRRRQPWHH